MVVKTQKSGGMPKREIRKSYHSDGNGHHYQLGKIWLNKSQAKLLSWQQIKQPEPGQLGAVDLDDYFPQALQIWGSRIEFLLKLAVDSWFQINPSQIVIQKVSMVHICKCIYCIYIVLYSYQGKFSWKTSKLRTIVMASILTIMSTTSSCCRRKMHRLWELDLQLKM